MGKHEENAASFDRAADAYERGRPEYPAGAVDWLVPAGAKTVLDLGAGTGKLTRALTARGLEVFAVDPSPKMLDQLREAVPGAIASEGTAEDIPLADASVDAILVAQAWHWVDQDLALPSVARVLRPGGTLGLVWNIRDERTPWVARLTTVMHQATGEQFIESGSIQQGPFGPIEKADFEWSREFTRPEIIDLLRSRSYFITASTEEQARIVAGVNELLDTDPDVGGQQAWTMPYVTHCFRMRLPA
ncbi:MAG TPA: class I SAM-dependent methyltransferase [Galbitalea sp.]|nr:class I SAM-dependent methyltransferase [Galbitalea sp.]